MKKISLYLLILMAGVVYSCGEAGIQSNVSKTIEEQATIEASVINANSSINETILVDVLGDDFEEYRNDIDNFFINRIEIEVTDYANVDNTTTNYQSFVLKVGTSQNSLTDFMTGSEQLAFLSAFGTRVANTNKILLFDIDEPGALLNASSPGITQLIQWLNNGTPFYIGINGSLSGAPVADDFNIKFYLDLTAKVVID
jgi:hypothetical protein